MSSVKLNHVYKRFDGGVTAVSDFCLEIADKEFIIFVGPSGCGKSTLIKLIIGKLEPVSGIIEAGYNVEIGYYDQENQNLDPQNTVLDELWNTYPRMTETEIRNTLGQFRFVGEDVYKEVSVLSGGERARLTLAKLILSKMNLLVLDEPTNHLDIDSREALEAALEGFDGTIFAVSHDRYFIERFANRIWAFSMDGTVLDYQGTYPEYRSYLARQIVFRNNEAEKKKTSAETESKPKKRSPNSKTAAKIEREIARKEERMAQLTKDEETFSTDYEKLTLEISTDGSIAPKDALTEAAKLLIYHFMLFSDERIIIEDQAKPAVNAFDEEHLRMRQLLNQRLVDMDLSVRALNCLKAAEVDTLGQLVKYHRSDLLKFRNFGKKSLTELDELLEKNGLAFGMDISRFKLND